MKRSLSVCCIVVFALALISPAAAEDAKGQPSPEEMMAEYMKMGQPGPQHEQLKPLLGSWKTVTKMWLAPGAEPQMTEGSSKVTSIMGGRFLNEEFSSTFMGMPFQGFGITGYDNIKKAFVGTWIDSMGTSIMLTKGTVDSEGKTITWMGTHPDLDGSEKSIRMVHKMISNDERVLEFYEDREGQEVKSMEIAYKRQ